MTNVQEIPKKPTVTAPSLIMRVCIHQCITAQLLLPTGCCLSMWSPKGRLHHLKALTSNSPVQEAAGDGTSEENRSSPSTADLQWEKTSRFF